MLVDAVQTCGVGDARGIHAIVDVNFAARAREAGAATVAVDTVHTISTLSGHTRVNQRDAFVDFNLTRITHEARIPAVAHVAIH